MTHALQHLLAAPTALALATVTNTVDPQGRGRVEITLAGVGLSVWAPCVMASAGQGYGVALLPKIGEVVLAAFLTPDQPFVLGAVWQGAHAAPADESPVETRYVIRTPGGTRMIFDDNPASLTLATPNGNKVTLTDSGNSFKATLGATSIEATPGGVTVTTSASVQVKASSVSVSAPSVKINAAMSQFSGVVQCDTLIATTVMGTSYTPGAGNIW